jgi:hypothetical protein
VRGVRPARSPRQYSRLPSAVCGVPKFETKKYTIFRESCTRRAFDAAAHEAVQVEFPRRRRVDAHPRCRWRRSLGHRRRPSRGTAGGRPGLRNRAVRLDREPPPRTSRTPPPPRTRARSSSRPSRAPPRRTTS